MAPTTSQAGKPEATPGEPPPAVVDVARDVRTLPLAARIEAVSAALLGTPYSEDPAGEGAGHDPDPPGRYDAFDCLTYVEEVLSLSLAADPVDAGRIRRALRYGSGDVAWANRRHFMELQWLPGAVADGWLVDTTASYGPVQTLSRTVTADDWARWPGRGKLPLPDDALPTGPMTLTYLPLATATAALRDVAPGSVLAVVRVDRADTPLWITHVGFAVRKDGRTVLRHASHMTSSRKVTEHDLAWYLGHLATFDAWPVAGIAVFAPVDPGPPRATP
ncbi:MAG: DUF1460 domain-containing protein [Alphaproteobacteria bacterium]|nr:DUF1460 domain-containing protein [Alphaproteobacteria bacterium]